MPERPGLFGQRRHQLGVRMAQRVDGNARAQIEKASPVRLDQPGPFAFDERERRAVIGWQDRRDHGGFLIKQAH